MSEMPTREPDADAAPPAHRSHTGAPAPAPSGFRSLAAMYLDRVERTPERDALYYPDASDAWQTLTWRQVHARVESWASGLRALGLEDEQLTAILSQTRYEWVLADLAVLCAGGATTTIYPSSTAEECAFILTDSGARFAFVEDAAQVEKLVRQRAKLPNLAKVITLTDGAGENGWVIGVAELERLGRERAATHPGELEQVVGRIRLDRLATLIYTSGTTGTPKGVELLHDCWVYAGEAMDALGVLRADDKQYLWLPLSHSFGKLLLVSLIKIGIPTAIDGRIPKLVDNLSVVKPTFMAAAPRIFEKVYNTVVTGARADGGLKHAIFRWAVGVGRQVSELRQQGKRPSGFLALANSIADRLVFAKLRKRFGGNIRFFISGAAPLSREIAEFFHAFGILVLEGYGLTESSAASFVNLPHRYKFGSVGVPLPGTEAILSKEDGEILIRSRGVMRGYRGLAEASAETLRGRWLATGDIGEIDENGFLTIVDRKKDLIKTSGGKYVAPQHLESVLKAACPYLSQVMVVGDNRNFCTALVTLDPDAIGRWAKEAGLGHLSYGDLTRHPQVRGLVQDSVDAVNAGLARYETIKKFAILESDFSIEGGELTSSMKVKRKAVEAKYEATIDGFYAGALQDV
jgi:long-chain acyl-CoA synthetase